MNDVARFLDLIKSNLCEGLDMSCGSIGLTREDSEKMAYLRDAVCIVVGKIAVFNGSIKSDKKEDKSYEKTKTKK